MLTINTTTKCNVDLSTIPGPLQRRVREKEQELTEVYGIVNRVVEFQAKEPVNKKTFRQWKAENLGKRIARAACSGSTSSRQKVPLKPIPFKIVRHVVKQDSYYVRLSALQATAEYLHPGVYTAVQQKAVNLVKSNMKRPEAKLGLKDRMIL